MPTTTEGSETNNNEPYQITSKTICNAFLNLICSSPFMIYFTYGYNLIPSDLKYRTLSRLLLAYIIIGWITLIPKFLELSYSILYYGQITTLNIWNNLILPTKKIWLRLMHLIGEYGLIGIGCYFMPNFIPYSNSHHHCNIFDESNHHICQAYRIISILTIICLILWGLILIIVIILCLISKCNESQSLEHNSIYRDAYHVANSIPGVSSYFPIDYNPPADRICAICFVESNITTTTDEVEGQQHHELWKTLICQHKFHPACIDPWLIQHRTCPICRCEQPI
jgi:preprotein translocase subunit SecG